MDPETRYREMAGTHTSRLLVGSAPDISFGIRLSGRYD
jgi:hypothetical protein